MKKYILFGAGQYGKKAIELLGKENILFFLDNDEKKQGTRINEIPVYSFSEKSKELSQGAVVLAVSEKYQEEQKKQLKEAGMFTYQTMQEVQTELTREKILARTNYLDIYKKAIAWIHSNTINGEAIVCTHVLRKGYPEVTGYYIPTLLRWGYRELALDYAKWLCHIQKEDGSWYDTEDTAPYVFDTAQILKGLLAIRGIFPKADENIKKGCDWILSNMKDSGRLTTPTQGAWGNGRACSELIHLYCLSPLKEAGVIFGNSRYIEAAAKILSYYKENHRDDIMNFGLLSHFYAYVMEALLDMGETEMAKEAMEKVALLQKDSGAVPAYRDVDWVCSTGLFQFALVWFRLGEIERGRKAFSYACKLQNASGGWYGSYLSEENGNEQNDYFPTAEISWAVKYFLDALYYKNLAEFDAEASIFLEKIEKADGRYQAVLEGIRTQKKAASKGLHVLDIGCGKGRYLKNLLEDVPENTYYAVDLSEKVMENIPTDKILVKRGSLTQIPYDDNCFDVAYTCEALEHAIDIGSAIRELCRVVRPGGSVIVIDKNAKSLGCMEIGEWEQWFEEGKLKTLLLKYCNKVEVQLNIPYENAKIPNLFSAWVGTVK